jgi:hypothetical protein
MLFILMVAEASKYSEQTSKLYKRNVDTVVVQQNYCVACCTC